MELSDANLQTLTEYLKKTLDPDPAIRRPGKDVFVLWLTHSLRHMAEILLCNCLVVNLKIHTYIQYVHTHHTHTRLLIFSGQVFVTWLAAYSS